MATHLKRYLYQRSTLLLLVGVCTLLFLSFNTDLNLPTSMENHEQLLQVETETELSMPPSLSNQVTRSKGTLQDGGFSNTVKLQGIVISNATKIAEKYPEEFQVSITTSVVKSLSDKVEEHVKQIFNDEYGECKFHATLPAMVRRDGKIEIIMRIWLSQYEKMSAKYKRAGKKLDKMVYEWKNTWQENYLYSMLLDDSYNLIKPGNIMGLPTPTNAAFTYKSDGPMDPRLFTVGNDTYLSFHSWLVDPTFDNQMTGRLHLYDMNRNIKKKLMLNTRLHRTEINWIPLDVNGELYYTYSLDPLRVMKCNHKTALCKFIYEQKGTAQHPFVYTSDHLRGGTPWVLYKYPYYISVGHNVVVSDTPYHDRSLYNSNILVMSVDPWRLVYVSKNILYNQKWVTSQPIIRNQTILTAFFYPSGIIKQSDDVLDVSGHLNDAAGYVLRVRGIRKLMEEVMRRDRLNAVKPIAEVRAAQQYVMQAAKGWFPKWRFLGDIIAGTVEKPTPSNTV